MKKKIFITFVSLLLLFGINNMITAKAEEDTGVYLDPQIIYDKDYKNDGITGMYDVDIFASDEENVFSINKEYEYKYYLNLKKILFINKIQKSKSRDLTKQVENLNLFSSVDYHYNPYEQQNGKIDEFCFIAFFLVLLSGILGLFVAKIVITKKSRRKRKM